MSPESQSDVLARVRLRSPAKVNLHLEVLRRREDGYHDIETILQAVSLWDELEIALIERRAGGEPDVALNVEPYGAAPEDSVNLVVRAIRLFCERTGHGGALRCVLRKTIPVEAGLGGGSGNAAAALVACNRLFEAGLSDDELEELGAELGSDVPFFVRGGTQLARGRGTDLTPLANLRNGLFLIVKPALAFPTGAVYEGLNLGLTTRAPMVNIRNTEALIARFPKGSWFGHNRLEEAVVPGYPVLQRILEELRETASVTMLAGSGAAVFGVYDANRGTQGIEQSFVEAGHAVHLAKPLPHGVVFTEE